MWSASKKVRWANVIYAKKWETNNKAEELGEVHSGSRQLAPITKE